jgi:hypothetical protein
LEKKVMDAKFAVNNRRLLKVELTLSSYSFLKRTSGAMYVESQLLIFGWNAAKQTENHNSQLLSKERAMPISRKTGKHISNY